MPGQYLKLGDDNFFLCNFRLNSDYDMIFIELLSQFILVHHHNKFNNEELAISEQSCHICMKEGGHYEQDTEYNKLYKWL
jgi:hypothetical protein